MARSLASLVGTAIAAAVVYAIYRLLPRLLATAIPWFPARIDAWFVVFAAQVMLLVAVALVFRLPWRPAFGAGAGADGARAVFWVLCGGGLFALLGSITIVSSPPSVASGFRVADGLRALAQDFPISGLAGGVLRNFLLAPVFEELLFRAFILGWLLRAAPAWLALPVSTALFASVHDFPLAAAFSGLVFGLLYLRYGSLWLCITAHAGFNLTVAYGVPMGIAHLHETGLFHPVRGNLLPIQVVSLLVAVACYAMFVRCLREKGRRRRPIPEDPSAEPCAASSSPPATPASCASSATCSRRWGGRSWPSRTSGSRLRRSRT